MTEDRLKFIETCMVPTNYGKSRNVILELLEEVKRARLAEARAIRNWKLSVSLAQIFKQEKRRTLLSIFRKVA